MKENWKSIKGYAGLYEVSDLGNVRSLNYGRTFSAYNIFQYICPGFLVDDLDDVSNEDIEYEVSKGVFCFLDEENPF